MKAIANLTENIFLRNLSKKFRRSPLQLNQFLESDAELIRLEDGSTLAVTTDSIVEEIATGLYTDPAQIGWMTVAVNLSDLAAVGAEPLGILLSQNIPGDYPLARLEALQSGISEACETMGVFVLGGDTNQSKMLEMGGTAIGLIKSGPVISRRGIRPGDLLYVSGGMGLGSAYAFQVLMQGGCSFAFRPQPSSKTGEIVRHFGSACIDTSDGFFPAVCNLMELNGIGFKLTRPFLGFAHPTVVEMASENQMPIWFFLAGPHGEFELMFTVSPDKELPFLQKAKALDWHPIKIGEATADAVCLLSTEECGQKLEPFQIANLFTESGENPAVFLSALTQKQFLWKLS